MTGVGSRPAVPLTEDEAVALQKLLERAQVTIGHPILAGTTTLEEVQQLLTQRGLEDMAGNLKTELRQSKYLYINQMIKLWVSSAYSHLRMSLYKLYILHALEMSCTCSLFMCLSFAKTHILQSKYPSLP